MKVYVVEACGDEGGNVCGVFKSLVGCDELVKEICEDYGFDEITINEEKKWNEGIVRMYLEGEFENPCFAVREFELGE